MSYVLRANSDLGTGEWVKPWSGTNGGNCVEAKKLSDGRVAVRQSTEPDGPALIYTLGNSPLSSPGLSLVKRTSSSPDPGRL